MLGLLFGTFAAFDLSLFPWPVVETIPGVMAGQPHPRRLNPCFSLIVWPQAKLSSRLLVGRPKYYSNKRRTTLKRWLKPSLLDQRHASPIALPAVPHPVHTHWLAPASLWRGLISKELLGTRSSPKSHSLTLQLQANAQVTCQSPVLGLETKKELGREGLGRGRALA